MPNIPGKPFTDTLGELAHGDLLLQLTEKQYEVISAVMETRKPGSITISIDYSPTGRGTVNVLAKVKAKVPEHDQESTTFFVGKDYALHRDNPEQHKLPLRAVDMPSNAPIRVGEHND